jgi:hypothetical protein
VIPSLPLSLLEKRILSVECQIIHLCPYDSSLNWVDWNLLPLAERSSGCFCYFAYRLWDVYEYWCSFGPPFLLQTRLQAQAAGVVYNPVSVAHNSMDDTSASNAKLSSAFSSKKKK